MSGEILAIDQGTTSTRAIVFDEEFRARGLGQKEFPQHFPASGLVEHEPEDIWQSAVETARHAMGLAHDNPRTIAAIGIANQRETTVIWDRATGRPIHRAIVWQDRRTADLCARLRAEGTEVEVSARTGLLIDPYFSASKIAWLLDHVPGARQKAEDGKLAFGTIDTFLLWRLTGGRVHATDATNASRTLLFNIATQDWDDQLLRLFRVPRALLPAVFDSAENFGTTEPGLFGAPIAIRGIAGDQQAATVGQACFAPGMVKATYGTGCFAVLNTGEERCLSQNRLLTTVAYRLAGRTTYALEGAIFVAGAVVQWLRDGLGFIKQAHEIDALAAAADPHQDVTLVPAFTGLGAPWWDADARGAIFGLTRNSGPREFARAALDSVCFQTADLLDAMKRDWRGMGDTVLRVDGGMVASEWTMQRLADLIGAPVDRPRIAETTALGVAWLAGMHAGVWPDQDEFARRWQIDRRFTPAMGEDDRTRRLARWRDAVRRTLSAPPDRA